VLLQAMHDIIGNSVAFFFRQLLAKTPYKFARGPYASSFVWLLFLVWLRCSPPPWCC
jgi:hypothetical protein